MSGHGGAIANPVVRCPALMFLAVLTSWATDRNHPKPFDCAVIQDISGTINAMFACASGRNKMFLSVAVLKSTRIYLHCVLITLPLATPAN